MATMVARGGSPLASPVSVQDKGSRNKRKFHTDPSNTEPNLDTPSFQSDCANYTPYPMEQNPESHNGEQLHSDTCNSCRTRACVPLREEFDQDQFLDADWNDLSESQLEETVLGNLDMIFKSAIKMVMSYGYTEEIATNSVLNTGLCFGCKDAVSNIVDKALAVLRSGQEVDSYLKENLSEEFKRMERGALDEMVGFLRDCQPSFSRGDAMWLLLVNDMKISVACTVEGNPSNIMGIEENSPIEQVCNSGSSSSSQTMPELNCSIKPSLMLPYPQNSVEPAMRTVVGIPSLPCGRFSASGNTQSQGSPTINSSKEKSMTSLSCIIEETASLSISSPSEGKPSGGKKGHLSSSKRESILRQKSVHFEKNCRLFGSKAVIRPGKQNGLGGLLLDKKSRSSPDPSNAVNMKNALMKLNKAVGSEEPVKTSNHAPPTLPNPTTELALASATTPSHKMGENWVPQDKMDEMIQKLVQRVKELEAQLQEWSDWAQQKVMQAARRLGKDKPELQNLRQEKEEVLKLKKEKQSLEENTRKKLAEMEIALAKAAAQVEKASAEARELQLKNAELRKELEAAKLWAAEAAASLQEALKREAEILKKIQICERQKAILQEELATEKKRFLQVKQQVEQAKEHYDQTKAKWEQEENLKEEALIRLNTVRKEREQIEVSGRAEENALKLQTETELQRYKDDIKKLELQISQVRQRTDASRIAALKWGSDGSYASRLSEGKNVNDVHIVSTEAEEEEDEEEEVQRDRECVMCLTEEITVVFLPCAHQVLCVDCNALHEKQGMKDCPSCRTLIEKRICVRSAES